MSVHFYKALDAVPDSETHRPQLALYWLHFNSDKTQLARRNKHRHRMGLPKILDEGRRLIFELWCFGVVYGFNWTIRPTKYEGHS